VEWFKHVPYAVTICDAEGILLDMNERAAATFEADGGRGLIGKNLIDCHPEPSRSALLELLREQKQNLYTIQKGEIKKLIVQTPWYNDGEFAGLVELSIVLPEEMPHFIRG